jgi:hypothetical protein
MFTKSDYMKKKVSPLLETYIGIKKRKIVSLFKFIDKVFKNEFNKNYWKNQ